MKMLLSRRALPLLVILAALALPTGASATVPNMTMTAPAAGTPIVSQTILIAGTSSNIDVTGYYYLDGVGPDPAFPYTAYAFGETGTRTLYYNADISFLSDGLHNIQAGAVPADNPDDRTGVYRNFIVDNSAPILTLNSPVEDGASTAETSLSWTFSSTDNHIFRCSIDGAALQACSSPVSRNDLTDGEHSFSVIAEDSAGNQSPPQGVTFTVNTAWVNPPETTFTSKPDAPITGTTANFSFASLTATSFECSLDGGAFSACTSPHSVFGLSLGQHTLSVRGIDPTLQVETTPEVAAFTVVAPPIVVLDAPKVSILSAKKKSLSLNFSGPGSVAAKVESCKKKKGKTKCKSFTTGSGTATAAGNLTIALKKSLTKKSKYRITLTISSPTTFMPKATLVKTIKAK
jgi:hypothetical protein